MSRAQDKRAWQAEVLEELITEEPLPAFFEPWSWSEPTNCEYCGELKDYPQEIVFWDDGAFCKDQCSDIVTMPNEVFSCEVDLSDPSISIRS